MRHYVSARTIHIVLSKLNGRGLVLADDQAGETTWAVTTSELRDGRVWFRLGGQDLSFRPERKFWVA